MADRVAVYCRLSEEDRHKKNPSDDSGSIQNQKLMLTEYASQQGWEVYSVYVDDDYAGSDRERPAFNRMLTDARCRRFDIILCKTQSRFTRELEMVEKYIHGLFPEWGIRFVSIVDNIDTAVAGNKKTRQINGLINEWYLEDMSDSIKSALRTRMKAGYFIGAFAPYGYRKDPDNKGHLLIDEEAAEVVREIFRLYNDGVGRLRIARILNERGIPSPEAYYLQKGIKQKGIGKEASGYWKYYTVSHILENEVYIGHLVQGRTHNPTYKSKHTVPSDPSQWVRIENAHEPIIDSDTWETNRRLWQERTKPCYEGTLNKYAGILICAKCGYKMGVAYNKHKRLYRCTAAKYGTGCCDGVSIFESTLDQAIQDEIADLRDRYLDRSALSSVNLEQEDSITPLTRLKQQVKRLETKVRESGTALRSLYIDKLKGVITEEQFVDLSAVFTSEKEGYQASIAALEQEIVQAESQRISEQQKRQLIEEILSFQEITRPFVTTYIQKIEIGGTRQDRVIHIYWKF